MGIFLIFSLGQTKDPIKGLVELRLGNDNDCVRSLRVRLLISTLQQMDGMERIGL